MLLGRKYEQRVIRDLVAGVPDTGGAMVVIGDPGIGKSTLAGLARQFAAEQGMMILAATGVPAESRLPYAGLHQLLGPLRDRVDALPGPRRGAIFSAFGKDTDHAPDRFLVALAVTDLMTAAAADQPLLVLADDAHWLDPATCDVLAFLGCRVDTEPVVLLATVRDGYHVPLLDVGLAELRLDGLDEEASAQLLDAIAPALSSAARRVILDTSLGNPLALSELSRSALHADRDPFTAGGGAAVTYRIEKAFAARWSELPGQTQAVLLVAALNEGGTLGETLDAASAVTGVPLTTEAVTPAIAARLVEAGNARLQFRHPLVRSAIQYRAGLSRITAAHEALAAVLPDQPDRRAWHRAAAALGPDENVAAELDQAASRAERRGAISVAITALERAVELSLDPTACNSRLLRAAQLSFELGRPVLVDRFVRSVARAGLALADRARLALLQESVETGPAEGTERIRYLTGLSREVAADGQLDLAMDLLLGAARRCWWADPGRHVRLLVATTAMELASDQMHPTLQPVLAFAAPDVYGSLARDNLAAVSLDAGLDAVQLTHLGIAGTILGAFERSRVLLAAAIPQLREQRRLGLLVRALNHDANSAVYACQWDDVIAASDESERAAAEAGQHRWVALSKVPKALVAGLRGEDAELEKLASEAEQVLLPAATGSAIALLQIARGLAALGRRDYTEAYEYLLRIFDPADSAYNHLLRMYHIGDLADAACHSGHRARARELIEELSAGATEESGPLLAVSLAFGIAMLADDEEAGAAFEQALTKDLRRWPLHYARLKLEYGGWLRRHRQPAHSREHLRTARDILDALGARAWRDRADTELRASGQSHRADSSRASRFGQLTAQEQHIARMVLDGLSNREIGERLSVSHRTVGSHLYRMFPKLGITSRAELGAVLAEAGVLGED
jgi:DNA-binding CsgD family transcriptional regulator